MGKPFHELTEAEFKALVLLGTMTWAECAETHPQPSWCGYPGAVQGEMGCWSLMAFRVTGPEFCVGCDCYKENNS